MGDAEIAGVDATVDEAGNIERELTDENHDESIMSELKNSETLHNILFNILNTYSLGLGN